MAVNEYKAVQSDSPNQLAQDMTKLGRSGWRLVTDVDHAQSEYRVNGTYVHIYTAYMERPACR